MHTVTIPAPTVNRIPRSKGGFKKKANGKRADPVPRPVWLNANQRLNHHQKANWTKLWREAGMRAAIDNDLPVMRGQPHGARNRVRPFAVGFLLEPSLCLGYPVHCGCGDRHRVDVGLRSS